ncbi:MAG TPA: hypothetical protein DCP31_32135 [Cyanobacteria bacterium UBA8543]|nr:hypothetical protein [Cyanobacteria bacterium UBA8543]
MDGVRELLVDSVPSGYVLNVVDEVSKYVARKAGLSLEYFAAVLRSPQQVKDSEIAGNIRYFATVTAKILRHLGGEYVQMAEDLESDYFEKDSYPTISSINETFEHGYALLIGVGECQHKLFSLPVTVKDTQALYATLVDPELCAYPKDRDHIRVINNKQATRLGILEAFQWLKRQTDADPEATVFVYYSGHGGFDRKDNRYYLIPHDIKLTKLAESSLSAEEFIEKIKQIQTERLLVIIDASHSGKMEIHRDIDEVNEANIEFKELTSGSKLGKRGAVFASSQGDQKSWIKDDSISLYTFHLIEALRGAANKPGDTVVRISHLMNYLDETVPKTAKKLYGSEQTPCFDFNCTDFVIAKLRGGKGLPDVPLLSEKGIDYTQLRKLLIAQDWQEADRETARVMLQASGQEERDWLDWDDMQRLPSTDLYTIDQLWLKYSKGKFGFSLQKKIWLSVGGKPEYYNDKIYKKLGELIGWYIKAQDSWLSWNEHTFTLDAPQGHLPRCFGSSLPSQQKNIRSELFPPKDLPSQVKEIEDIIDRIANNQLTEADIATLRQLLESGDRQIATQLGKYNVNIGEGKEIHIGDHIYQQGDDEAIQKLSQVLSADERQITTQLGKYNVNIGEGKEIHIGDPIYVEWNHEAIQKLLEVI